MENPDLARDAWRQARAVLHSARGGTLGATRRTEVAHTPVARQHPPARPPPQRWSRTSLSVAWTCARRARASRRAKPSSTAWRRVRAAPRGVPCRAGAPRRPRMRAPGLPPSPAGHSAQCPGAQHAARMALRPARRACMHRLHRQNWRSSTRSGCRPSSRPARRTRRCRCGALRGASPARAAHVPLPDVWRHVRCRSSSACAWSPLVAMPHCLITSLGACAAHARRPGVCSRRGAPAGTAAADGGGAGCERRAAPGGCQVRRCHVAAGRVELHARSRAGRGAPAAPRAGLPAGGLGCGQVACRECAGCSRGACPPPCVERAPSCPHARAATPRAGA